MKTSTLLRILCACTLFVGASPAPLLAADPEFYCYYRGQKRALELDDANVAVRLASHGNSGARPTMEQARTFAGRGGHLGYQAEEAESFRPNGWIRLETKSAIAKVNHPAIATKREKHKKLIDDLAAIADAEFVCPIFKDKKGNPIHFEATLLIGFVDGTTEAAQAAILSRVPNVRSVGRHGPRNKWQLQTTFKNGLALLDTANEIAALPGVRYAEPNFVVQAELK